MVTPRLTNTFKVLNSLFNTLAYNPPGTEEGYLFWASLAQPRGRERCSPSRTPTAPCAAAS